MTGAEEREPPGGDKEGIEKARLEVEELRERLPWERTVGRILPVVSALVLVGGFIGGLVQYGATKREEYRQKFWDKQLEIYSSITTSAARTAATRDSAGRSRAFQQFEETYHGVFVLVADDSAALAAKNFYNTYIDYAHDLSKEADLPVAARSLSLAARWSLARTSKGLLDVGGLTLF